MNSLSKWHLMNQGTQFQLKNFHIPKLFCCFWKSCITVKFIECIPSARSKHALFCLEESEELSFHTWYKPHKILPKANKFMICNKSPKKSQLSVCQKESRKPQGHSWYLTSHHWRIQHSQFLHHAYRQRQ